MGTQEQDKAKQDITNSKIVGETTIKYFDAASGIRSEDYDYVLNSGYKEIAKLNEYNIGIMGDELCIEGRPKDTVVVIPLGSLKGLVKILEEELGALPEHKVHDEEEDRREVSQGKAE